MRSKGARRGKGSGHGDRKSGGKGRRKKILLLGDAIEAWLLSPESESNGAQVNLREEEQSKGLVLLREIGFIVLW